MIDPTKLCVDCNHHKVVRGQHMCGAFPPKLLRSAVTGEYSTNGQDGWPCETLRTGFGGRRGLCGLEATYFEPKVKI